MEFRLQTLGFPVFSIFRMSNPFLLCNFGANAVKVKFEENKSVKKVKTRNSKATKIQCKYDAFIGKPRLTLIAKFSDKKNIENSYPYA